MISKISEQRQKVELLPELEEERIDCLVGKECRDFKKC